MKINGTNYNFNDPATVEELKAEITDLLKLLPPAQRAHELTILQNTLRLQQDGARDCEEAALAMLANRLRVIIKG